jgi:hypothetical protein
MATDKKPQTLEELADWLARAPAGTMIPAGEMASVLADLAEGAAVVERYAEAGHEVDIERGLAHPSWRERLWTAPAETRVGVRELSEATGRPKSWVYRHTGPRAKDRIPHRRIDGELVFVVGELRHWFREHEVIVEAGPVADGRRLGVAR